MGRERNATCVLVSRHGAVLTITLDRPHRRNALDSACVSQLSAAIDAVGSHPGIRAVLLTGSPPVFCAGSDVAELASLAASARGAAQAFWPELEARVRSCPAPVIAAIAGGAWGGGLFLATFADVRIAADDARFSAPEVSLGWIPPGGIEALIDLVGLGAATDLVLTGRTIGAAEAHVIGLVTQVAPADSLGEAAMNLAQGLAAMPPAGVASTRHYLRVRPELDRRARGTVALERFANDVITSDADRSLTRFGKR